MGKKCQYLAQNDQNAYFGPNLAISILLIEILKENPFSASVEQSWTTYFNEFSPTPGQHFFFSFFLLRHFFRTRVLNFDPVQRLLLLKTLIENKKRASIAMREIYTDINQLWCPLSKTVMSIVQMNPNHSFSETWKKQDKAKQLLFASNVSNVNFVVVISQQIFLTSCKNIHSVVVSCYSTFSGFFSSSVDWSVDSIDSCARSSDPEVIQWVLMLPLLDQEQTAEVRLIEVQNLT